MLCVHATCPSQSERRLIHFASSLDIKGLGPAIVKELMNYELLKDMEDVFELHKHREFLTDLPGWAERSVEVLLAAIEEARTKATLADVLVALGIPHVGRDTANLVTRAVPTFSALQLLSVEQLRAIPKLGDKTASAIYEFFHSQQPSRVPFMLTNLVQHLPTLRNTDESSAAAQQQQKDATTHTHELFTGKSVVITGAFAKMERSAIEQRLRALGAEIKPSVTAKVNVVVAGELKSMKKLDAAKSLGIRVVTETELLKALEEATPL
jgi:DNA ligase (NAD+)